MGESFHVLVAEGTVGTISFYFHFVAHVSTRGYSVPNFIVKLNELKVIAKAKEKCREHPPPVNVPI